MNPTYQDILNARDQRLPNQTYKLAEGNRYGLDVSFGDSMSIDEKRMSALIPYADGNRRDGVGDVLRVEGIETSRHRKNPIHLFDHGKTVSLPVGLVEDPETGSYTGRIDFNSNTASDLVFYYQGKGIVGLDKTKEYDHALFCQQLFHLLAQRYIRAGSIGYQVLQAREIPPDYQRGIPKGLDLISVLKLESSTVVMPANADTVRKMLCLPEICGKRMSPMLVKSLEPYAPEKKAQLGYEKKGAANAWEQLKDDIDTDKTSLSNYKEKIERVLSQVGKEELRSFLQSIGIAERPTSRSHAARMMQQVISHQLESRTRSGQGSRSSGTCEPGQTSTQTGCTPSEKSLDSLRKKYRKSAKGFRRRLRKSSPGTSLLRVAAKDMQKAKEEAEKKGLKFEQVGAEKVKLIGDDSSIDEIAKSFGKRVKSMQIKADDARSRRLAMLEEIKPKLEKDPDFQRLLEEFRKPPSRGTNAGDEALVRLGRKIAQRFNIEPFEVGAIARSMKSIQVKKEKAMNKYHKKEYSDADMDAAPENEGGEVEREEPYGSQVLRRLHEDHSLLMKDYDEMMGPLENEKVKARLQAKLEAIEGELTEFEELFTSAYPDLDGLVGTKDVGDDGEELQDTADEEVDGDPDNIKEEVEDELEPTEKDMDTMDDSGVPASGEEREEVDEDEVVEGMQNGQKSLRSLRKKYGKKDQDEEDEKEKKEKEKRMKKLKTRRKDLCQECQEDPCACKKSLRKGLDPNKVKVVKKQDGWYVIDMQSGQRDGPFPDEASAKNEMDAWIRIKGKKVKYEEVDPEEIQGVIDQDAAGQAGTKNPALIAQAIPAIAGAVGGGSLASHEKGYVKEGSNFLGEVAQPQSQLDEEGRMKSYHYHKTFEGIGQLQQAHDDLAQTPPGQDIPPAEFEPGPGAKELPNIPVQDAGQPPVEPDNPEDMSRKTIGMASGFFKELAFAHDFGDPHRQKAAYWKQQLDPIAAEEAPPEEEPPLDDAPPGVEMEEGSEEEKPEPGEMGEKDLKALLKLAKEQTKEIEQLNGRLASLPL